MNKLYSSLAGVVMALSPVEGLGQQATAGQVQQKKDTSIIESSLKTFDIFESDLERQGWAQKYDPTVDYLLKYQDVVQEIWKLDLVQYKNSHFLADRRNSYNDGYTAVFFGDEKVDFAVPKDYLYEVKRSNVAMMMLSVRYDYLQTVHWDEKLMKTVEEERVVQLSQSFIGMGCDYSYGTKKRSKCHYKIDVPKAVLSTKEQWHTFTSDEINQVYYVGAGLARAMLDTLRIENQKWKDTSWRKLKEEFKDSAFVDKKTGEFVFYGDSSCEPCELVTSFLFDHKIPFVERSQIGAPGYCSGVPYILEGKSCYGAGAGVIIDITKKMYDFSEPTKEATPIVPVAPASVEVPVKKSKFKQK